MNIINLIEILFFFAVCGFFIKKLASEYEENNKQEIEDKKPTIKLVDKEELDVVSKIKEIDANFSEDSFIFGAKKAFKMIAENFNFGNIDKVKKYISKDIFNTFDSIISKRKAEELTSYFSLIGFKKVTIKDIKLTGNIASIKVEFISEQANCVKDKAGNVVSGKDNYVGTFTDNWTFTRNLKTKDPNWTLIATQDL